MHDVILERWTHKAEGGSPVPILPDGCRDVILMDPPGARPFWFLSPLQVSVNMSFIAAGTRLTGYRLRPGTRVNLNKLRNALPGHDCSENLNELICDATIKDAGLHDALARLAQGAAGAARDLGLSERSLQRLLRGHGLPAPPIFWSQLARARRAGRAAALGQDLAGGVAAEHGYADQAHMTRSLRRFFGGATPPRQLRDDPHLAPPQLVQPGGLATGEQISTR